jgi:hypothetical protein
MKFLKIILSIAYLLLAVWGIISVFRQGQGGVGNIIPTIFSLVVVAGLNKKGGKIVFYISMVTGSIMSLCYLLSIYSVLAPIFKKSYDIDLVFATLITGITGIATVSYLLNTNKNNGQNLTKETPCRWCKTMITSMAISLMITTLWIFSVIISGYWDPRTSEGVSGLLMNAFGIFFILANCVFIVKAIWLVSKSR